MKEIKSKIEAVLYANPKGIEIRKIAQVCGIGSIGYIKNIIKELQDDFKYRGLQIIEKNGLWKFTIKDEHLNLARESAKPEIDKAVLQTLAYIAHKKNARQSDVVKIRSNKAYNHINWLQREGFVEAKKKGNTRILSLTKKFYDYFDLEENKDINFETDKDE